MNFKTTDWSTQGLLDKAEAEASSGAFTYATDPIPEDSDALFHVTVRVKTER